MKDKGTYSPLYKIRRTLKTLRWMLGFPLQIKCDSSLEFKFVTWLECIRFTALLLVFLANYFYWYIVLLIYDGNLNNWTNVEKESLDKYSASKVDQVSTFLWLIIVVIKSLAYVVVFKYCTKSINKCCKDMSDIKTKMVAIIIRKE